MIGAIGDREHVQRLGLEGHAGRRSRSSRSCGPTSSPRTSSRHGERTVIEIDGRRDRRRALLDDRRAVHGRVARPGALDRAHRGRRRRLDVPRRRVQAALLAVQLPGARRRRACACWPRPRRETGLPIVTELMDARDVEPILEVADVIQVGARNMQNYPLLAEIGRTGKPVLIKRGLSSTARRAADGRRVRPQGGQPERDAVRARHPHVRDRLPLHARHHGHPDAQGALAPARDRRPVARARAPRHGAPAVAGRRRRRARTASSSRCTRTPKRPSATARSRSTPRSSRAYLEQVERAAAVAGKVLSAAA